MEIEKEVTELESQVRTLLKRYQEISNENDLLRQKLAKLLQENALNVEKKQKAIVRIKQIIDQLRSTVNVAKRNSDN